MTQGGISAWTDFDGDGTATAALSAGGLLAGTHYDPLTAQTKPGTATLAMTAFDTTNLRLTFNAPATNGAGLCAALVRMRTASGGATTSAQFLYGVLDGATVKARQAPLGGKLPSPATGMQCPNTTEIVITGLTPGKSYTWDAAYGVELAVASSVIRYGGPNDTTGGNNWGGFGYEIWGTPGLLAATNYDPATASTSVSLGSLLALTAIDTTNLRLTFTAPTSGSVLARIRGVVSGTTTAAWNWQWGVLEGATLRGRAVGQSSLNNLSAAPLATDQMVRTATILVTGLTPGQSYTWDAAYAVDTVLASGVIKMGGPDNTTQDDAWGGFSFDIWDAAYGRV